MASSFAQDDLPGMKIMFENIFHYMSLDHPCFRDEHRRGPNTWEPENLNIGDHPSIKKIDNAMKEIPSVSGLTQPQGLSKDVEKVKKEEERKRALQKPDVLNHPLDTPPKENKAPPHKKQEEKPKESSSSLGSSGVKMAAKPLEGWELRFRDSILAGEKLPSVRKDAEKVKKEERKRILQTPEVLKQLLVTPPSSDDKTDDDDDKEKKDDIRERKDDEKKEDTSKYAVLTTLLKPEVLKQPLVTPPSSDDKTDDDDDREKKDDEKKEGTSKHTVITSLLKPEVLEQPLMTPPSSAEEDEKKNDELVQLSPCVGQPEILATPPSSDDKTNDDDDKEKKDDEKKEDTSKHPVPTTLLKLEVVEQPLATPPSSDDKNVNEDDKEEKDDEEKKDTSKYTVITTGNCLKFKIVKVVKIPEFQPQNMYDTIKNRKRRCTIAETSPISTKKPRKKRQSGVKTQTKQVLPDEPQKHQEDNKTAFRLPICISTRFISKDKLQELKKKCGKE